MQPTQKTVQFFKENGWTDSQLVGTGYVVDGQPTGAIIEALKASGWTEDTLTDHGMVETPSAGVKPDAKVQRYLDLRAEKEALAKTVKEKEKPIKEEMGQIESELGGILQQMGQTSMAAKGLGTFFFVDKQYVSMAEHEAFLRWFCQDIINTLAEGGFVTQGDPDEVVTQALEAPALAFLTKAVAKDTVVQYIKDKGNPPPGIKHETVQEVQVRRSS